MKNNAAKHINEPTEKCGIKNNEQRRRGFAKTLKKVYYKMASHTCPTIR